MTDTIAPPARTGVTPAPLPLPDDGDILAALPHALGRGELSLVFQPAVDLGDGSLVGVEALVRWDHPEFGRIPPGLFIPVAEEAGLLPPIGAWVLEEACCELGRWLERYPAATDMSLFVNLSASELSRPGIRETIAHALRESGIEPRHLVLEITESAVLPDREAIVETLWRIHELGVAIALDGIGTPRSSLLSLVEFPIDAIKLERSFVRRLTQSERDRVIVGGMIDIARTLGLVPVAMGVETLEELQILRDLGCQHGQGFFWSRPLAAERLEEWLAAPPTPLFAGRRRAAALPPPELDGA